MIICSVNKHHDTHYSSELTFSISRVFVSSQRSPVNQGENTAWTVLNPSSRGGYSTLVDSVQKLYAVPENSFQSKMKVCYLKKEECVLGMQSNQTMDRFRFVLESAMFPHVNCKNVLPG